MFTCNDVARAAGLEFYRSVGDEDIYSCPVHKPDKHPSFHVNKKKNCFLCGPCHASGSAWQMLAFIFKLDPADKKAVTEKAIELGLITASRHSERSEIEETYDYTDENGKLLYQTVRLNPKSFYQRRPDKENRNKWINKLDRIRRVPYRLPKILVADDVFIVEGEKDVHTMEQIGFTATCNAGGAGKWLAEFKQYFNFNQDITILPDNDKAGKAHAQNIAENLYGTVRSVKIVELPGLAEKEDISDWIKGKDLIQAAEQLAQLADSAQIWCPHKQDLETNNVVNVVNVVPSPYEYPLLIWPEMHNDAFYGLAGDFVKKVEPHTESDPIALLGQFLIFFGNVISRNAYFEVEAVKHFCNLYMTLVGQTSKARKGTSLAQVRLPFSTIDKVWDKERIQFGLSTGEGLIHAVRDESKEYTKKKNGEKNTDEDQYVVTDPGVNDKRLLIVEEEFASVLKIMKRAGNTLSPTVRKAWDSGDLSSLSKNSPGRATGAHISMICHITREELLRHMDSTEYANGFGNRYLWFSVHRSKMLPDGGDIQSVNFYDFNKQLSQAINFARRSRKLQRDNTSSQLWRHCYPVLSEGKLGLLGELTSRAEAQVVRLSGIYALLDQSEIIREEHLKAALAVWKYCEDSAKFIFGERLGNPVADEILKQLRKRVHGMVKTEIRDHFGRNKPAAEIDSALEFLIRNDLIRFESEPASGQGRRPAERFYYKNMHVYDINDINDINRPIEN